MGHFHYRRAQHRLIARALSGMNGPLLADHQCFFGGGTAISLVYGEYRQSNDIDFLVSQPHAYQALRSMVRKAGPKALFTDTRAIRLPEHFRQDEYGIRGFVAVGDSPIKFEIVAEGRISLDVPEGDDVIEGIMFLTRRDLAAEKIMANSDRFADTVTFNRDLIDLAFLDLGGHTLEGALGKAFGAYGYSAMRDLRKSAKRFLADPHWVERCLGALDVSPSRTTVLEKVSLLMEKVDHAEAMLPDTPNQ